MSSINFTLNQEIQPLNRTLTRNIHVLNAPVRLFGSRSWWNDTTEPWADATVQGRDCGWGDGRRDALQEDGRHEAAKVRASSPDNGPARPAWSVHAPKGCFWSQRHAGHLNATTPQQKTPKRKVGKGSRWPQSTMWKSRDLKGGLNYKLPVGFCFVFFFFNDVYKGTSPSAASLRSPPKDSVRPTFNLPPKNLLHSQYWKSGEAQGRRVRHPLDPPPSIEKQFWLTPIGWRGLLSQRERSDWSPLLPIKFEGPNFPRCIFCSQWKRRPLEEEIKYCKEFCNFLSLSAFILYPKKGISALYI